MNETLNVIHNRRSIRAFADKPIERETIDTILHAAMRAPTAGNMMLYSIIEVADQELKDKLATSCNNQSWIATAPLILIFLADYQRWFDFFMLSDVPAYCEAEGQPMRYPGEGELLAACNDALIAAQTAVIAAEALGISSCYIGSIMGNYEYHQELLNLPQYTFPAAMLCLGYPTPSAAQQKLVSRLAKELICFQDRYQRLDEAMLMTIYAEYNGGGNYGLNAQNIGQYVYARKCGTGWNGEITRSIRKAIEVWTRKPV